MALSAPFCPLANLLSPDQSGRWLVGAVGIEPTTNGLKVALPLFRLCGISELHPHRLVELRLIQGILRTSSVLQEQRS